MFEMLQKFILLATGACYISLGMYVCWRLQGDLNNYLKRLRGKRMLERAIQVGPVLYYNKVGKTTAVCRVADFGSTIRIHKPWQIGEPLWIRQTFVFRVDGIRARVHVNCNREEFRAMNEELIERATGYKKTDVDRVNFEKTEEHLIRMNPELFVPFSQELSEDEGRRQLDFYRSTPPFREIRQYLLSGIGN